jgi:flavin-dependent dehydrogenase
MVLGGGVAGLTAALQLKRLRPKTSVVVAEKLTHPVPEAAFKVGESGAEIGCHYLNESVGFEAHMAEQQLRKFSLRIFPSANGNADITMRPEIGLRKASPMRTWQIDRGRLENALAEAVEEAGVELLDGYQVGSVALGPDRHTAVVRREGSTQEVAARWLIDASGRVGLLRRQLGLGVEIPHDVNAAWFRVGDRIRVDDWSDDEAWQARVPTRNRWLSTNQLVGRGYWIWLIPLPSGSTSIGIVADERFVPFERIRRYDVLLEWLREHEAQLAAKLPQEAGGLQDFRKLKNYSYGTRRGLSANRWCLTGEAGLFLDPLYSTGLDFIGVANTLATHLIVHALDDEAGLDFKRRMKAYNAYYLGQFVAWEPTFAGQYEVFGDAQATAAKIVWDNASYFRFPVMLFLNDTIVDPEFIASIRDRTARMHPLNVWMQRCLRELSNQGDALHDAGFPTGTTKGLGEMFALALERLPKDEVRDRLDRHQKLLESLAHQLMSRMYEACGRPMPEPPMELAQDLEDDLITWVDYRRRTAPPAEAPPQPEDAWQII